MSKTMFESGSGHPFDIQRKSDRRSFRWRTKMPFKEVVNLQKKCGSTLTKSGYRIFKSKEEFTNLNISEVTRQT